MATAFKVNLGINDLQRTISNISRYSEATQSKLRNVVETSTRNIMMGATRRCPVRSGELAQSIYMTYDGQKNIGFVHVGSPHAHMVEFGHKGGYETHERAKALAFSGGYAAHVVIPTVIEHPFLRPAFQDEKPNLINNAYEAIKP